MFANFVRFNLHRELAITLVARKFSLHPASVPGAVAAMLLLPIPVAHPRKKTPCPFKGKAFFSGPAGTVLEPSSTPDGLPVAGARTRDAVRDRSTRAASRATRTQGGDSARDGNDRADRRRLPERFQFHSAYGRLRHRQDERPPPTARGRSDQTRKAQSEDGF